MKKLTKFCIGALAVAGLCYYAVDHLIKNDEFSNDTKENLDDVVKNAKNIGETVKRTYTSIGDKKDFEHNTKKLGNDVKKIYDSSISLVKDASNDMYSYFKDKITNKEDAKKSDNFKKHKNRQHKQNNKNKQNKKFNNQKTSMSDSKKRNKNEKSKNF